ncbi:hypothetical protein [Microcoleus sp. FACHB-831]|uniref:hypothetical protein n=1 Tax=Microcoleus sp. FACHB-831 TaxID=2692827 RepID=UPI001681D669|nr:hypothetical protein [Microcoleus sp. FACHB-831]
MQLAQLKTKVIQHLTQFNASSEILSTGNAIARMRREWNLKAHRVDIIPDWQPMARCDFHRIEIRRPCRVE